jgi:hypothetical protein
VQRTESAKNIEAIYTIVGKASAHISLSVKDARNLEIALSDVMEMYKLLLLYYNTLLLFYNTELNTLLLLYYNTL